jgi:AraC family L-rhamnose operon transcriptional activator RhaR
LRCAQASAVGAAVLLLHSDEPVTGIGQTVGWPDQAHFAGRFKAHYGLSATTYRKRFATQAARLSHTAEPLASPSSRPGSQPPRAMQSLRWP